VTVGSGVDKSLDDVVAAVSGLGVTTANLVGVSTLLPMVGGLPPSSLGCTFQLAVPFSKTKDATAALTLLRKIISKNNSGPMLSFALTGTRVSGQRAANRNLTDLVAQAQQTASASGLNAGAIVA
jgi:hypothetical protein